MMNSVKQCKPRPYALSLSQQAFRILLTVCLIVPVAVGNADELPELGDYSATVMSPLQEQAIANMIMRDVMASADVIRDVEINDYIAALGYRLAANSPNPRQGFNFFVVQDNTINAFAMYGGVIGVHTGLILAANNESELASVLGHEIGHVVQRHLARMIATQKRDSILNMAGYALAILAARSNPQLAAGALTATSASGLQKQLDYTREHEREADRVGLQILENAGYDPHAMPGFFNTLMKNTRFVDGAAPSFLRTHPLTTERISDIKNRVDNLPYKQVQDSVEFLMVRAKLKANVGLPEQTVQYYEQLLKEKRYANEAAERYGYAIALMRKQDYANAQLQIDWLKSNMALHPYVMTLDAKLAEEQAQRKLAEQKWISGLQRYPEHRALLYGYIEHMLTIGQIDKALSLIKDKQPAWPDDPYFFDLMSRAYTMLGKNLLRHQAAGEAYARKYNLDRAIEQMELAAKAGDGDFYQQSIVEARLKTLKSQVIQPEKEGWFN